KFIEEATGVTPTAKTSTTNETGTSSASGSSSAGTGTQTTDLSTWTADKLEKTDLTQLPKLSEEQISTLINKFFSGSGSVMKASDAAGIYQAQSQSGISALALLGIGALESG